ncbi:MAG: PQQ-binding-like beta-propeller repeat protein [Carboxylicivirga sp.]|jgi:outer membrane protein assembly factor BamB/predicted MPP superfamily phosphohydrolase|nr:PQQ-binding-like beta-propeller repeat protein [Carboxylicivirga sp.]
MHKFSHIVVRWIAYVVILSALLACQSEKEVRFAFLTDLHVEPGNPNELALQKVIHEINSDDFDFVVITGDLSNMGSDAELKLLKENLDQIKVPTYVLPGNHETNWSESGGATYQTLFGDDRFYFEMHNYAFLGFNTGPYMKMGDGHVKREDINWLKKVLSVDNDQITISMAHYPLTEGLDNWYEVSETLKKRNVKLALCGHGHRLQLLNFNNITGLMGRALIGRSGDDIGYNIVTIKGDSVAVKEKLLGKPQKIYRRWSLSNTTQIDSLPKAPKPIDNNSVLSGDLVVEEIYSDEASVMGGFAFKENALTWLASDGVLKVYNALDGEFIWQKPLGKPQYSTPVLYDEMVICGTSQGFIKAFDLNSGIERWRCKVGSPVFSEGIIDGHDLYIAAGKSGFYRIDARSGEVIWHFNKVGGFVQAKPCIISSEIIFGAWDRHLYCLDKSTGHLKWKWSNGHKAILYSPGNVIPVVANECVFIVAPDRYYTVLDLHDGSVLYRSNEHKVRESIGVSTNMQLVFTKLMSDSIVAFPTQNIEDGSTWATNVGFGYDHNPCALIESDGIVYGGTKNGELFAVEIKSQNLLWRYKISNSAINKIECQNYLLVCTMDGKFMRVRI